MSIKAPCVKAWSWVQETAQELRVLVLPVDLTPIPSTQVRRITTACNSSFRGSNMLLVLWRLPAHVRHSPTHIQKHKRILEAAAWCLCQCYGEMAGNWKTWGLVGRFRLPASCMKWLWGSCLLSLELQPYHEQLCVARHFPRHYKSLCYTSRSNRANWQWTKTFNSPSQNKPPFFISCLSQILCTKGTKDIFTWRTSKRTPLSNRLSSKILQDK